MNGLHVVILDPDTKTRNACYDALYDQGCKVFTIQTFEQLIILYKKVPLDFLIIDPEAFEEGEQILHRIPNEASHRLSVIIYTEDASVSMKKDYYRMGVKDVVSKELGLPFLMVRIRNHFKEMNKRPEERMALESFDEKVMIVDDDPDICNLLSTFFEKKGIEVLVAPTGEQAILLMEAEKPRIVLLDVTMPGMDGVIALQRMRAINPQSSYVMITCVDDKGVAQEAIENGASDYILKPLDFEYLDLVVMTRLMMAV